MLKENLGAFSHQAQPLDEILVIHNASIDNSQEKSKQNFSGQLRMFG
jgi:hypothetical protein